MNTFDSFLREVLDEMENNNISKEKSEERRFREAMEYCKPLFKSEKEYADFVEKAIEKKRIKECVKPIQDELKNDLIAACAHMYVDTYHMEIDKEKLNKFAKEFANIKAEDLSKAIYNFVKAIK